MSPKLMALKKSFLEDWENTPEENKEIEEHYNLYITLMSLLQSVRKGNFKPEHAGDANRNIEEIGKKYNYSVYAVKEKNCEAKVITLARESILNDEDISNIVKETIQNEPKQYWILTDGNTGTLSYDNPEYDDKGNCTLFLDYQDFTIGKMFKKGHWLERIFDELKKNQSRVFFEDINSTLIETQNLLQYRLSELCNAEEKDMAAIKDAMADYIYLMKSKVNALKSIFMDFDKNRKVLAVIDIKDVLLGEVFSYLNQNNIPYIVLVPSKKTEAGK